MEGVIRPIYHRGEKVGEIRQYSDILLIFRLKGLKPETYKEQVAVGGDKSNPLRVIQEMSPEDRRRRIAELEGLPGDRHAALCKNL